MWTGFYLITPMQRGHNNKDPIVWEVFHAVVDEHTNQFGETEAERKGVLNELDYLELEKVPTTSCWSVGIVLLVKLFVINGIVAVDVLESCGRN